MKASSPNRKPRLAIVGAVVTALILALASFRTPSVKTGSNRPDSTPAGRQSEPGNATLKPAAIPVEPASINVDPIRAAEAAPARLDPPAVADRFMFGSEWQQASTPSLKAFRDWTERYVAAAHPQAQADLVPEGVTLARQRREHLSRLIQTDPRAALAAAVPVAVRQQLPAAVASLLEERVSGRGDFEVLATVPREGAPKADPAVFRQAVLGGTRFNAHVFGQRRNQRTSRNVSLHGVSVDAELAVSESPLRVLEPGENPSPEKTSAEAVCSVSGLSAAAVTDANGPRLAESGDQVHWVCQGGHLLSLEKKVQAAEGGGSEDGVTAPSYRTIGDRKILVMLVDFSDRAGGPVSQATAQASLTDVTAFIRSNAFNQVNFSVKAVTPVLRMPRTGASYAGGDAYDLLVDARAAATAAGFNGSDYDFDVVAFAGIGFPWGGLGYVGSKGAWVQGTFDRGITAHELGHNLGNWHANSWLSSTIVGANGTHQEYGNPFDVLGGIQSYPRNHHSANFKFLNGWLPNSQIQTVTASGTYRIYAQDFGGSLDFPDRRYAIRIPVGISVGGETVDYWIDFRQNFPDNSAVANGAMIQWGNDQGTQYASRLLDMTPSTYADTSDAALTVGRTFNDPDRSLTVTTLAKGGSGADAYLDMAITIAFSPCTTVMIEAESATLTSPMRVGTDTLAGGGQYIYSTTPNSGSAAWTVTVPTAGQYVIWQRVLAVDADVDSFTVSVDGGARDIDDVVERTWSDYWQWTRVYGRGSSLPWSINPRIFNLSAGTHTLLFEGRELNTRLDRLILTCDLGFNPENIPLSDALDTPGQSWVSADGAWFGQVNVTHDGADAAQSKPLGNNQQTWMETSVTGPGQLTFWWKVSSQSGHDYLVFTNVGQSLSERISGELDWQPRTYDLPAGSHILRWTYAKDSSDRAGQDAAWVDQVSFTMRVPPANDSFASRIALSGPATYAIGNNVNASKEPGEPNHGGHSGGKSVWWTWTAPENSFVSINTGGSSIDTLLGVYSGFAVNALTLIAGDDDSGGNATSAVAFQAMAGTPYQIAVDGFSGASGDIQLNIYPVSVPANDLFANSQAIYNSSATVFEVNDFCTKEPGEPNHAGALGGKSVWWNWTARASGPVTIDTAGSSFDTVLGVYTGSTVNRLTVVASNDDTAGGHTSAVSFQAVAGTTYQIAVDSFGSFGGTIQLNLRGPVPPPPANDAFARCFVIAPSGGVVVGYNESASKEI